MIRTFYNNFIKRNRGTVRIIQGESKPLKYTIRSAIDPLFPAAGVMSLLFLLFSFNTVTFHKAVFFISAAYTVVLWLIFKSKMRTSFYISTVVILLTALSVFLYRETFVLQTRQIIGIISGAAETKTVSCTLFSVLIPVCLTPVLLWLWYCEKSRIIPCAVLSIIFLLAPMVGVRPNMPSVILFFIFSVGFFLTKPKYTTDDRSEREKRQYIKLALKTGSIALIMALGIFLVSSPLTKNNEEWLYGLVYRVDGFISRISSDSQTSGYFRSGYISRSNYYPGDTERLKLYINPAPEEQAVYLKGFSGGYYKDGEWDKANDFSVYEQSFGKDHGLDLRFQKLSFEHLYGGILYNANYKQNYNMDNNGVLIRKKVRNIVVQHLDGYKADLYKPYYCNDNSGLMFTDSGDMFTGYILLEYNESDIIPIDVYRFSYFEQKDMKINLNEDFNLYKSMWEPYNQMTKEVYTAVPTASLPRLTALCADNPFDTLDEITTFILETLQENTKYNRTPGLTSINKDVIESFLFERGEGYCVHYATAAALMYRLYGVPARYASGYRIPASAFKTIEDGVEVIVTDDMAHAWVEINLEGYGWTPVEVTPLSDAPVVIYPGYAWNKSDYLIQNDGESIMVPDNKDDYDSSDILRESSTGGAEVSHYMAEGKGFGWYLLTSVIFLVSLLPLVVYNRKLRRIERFDSMNCREVYFYLTRLVRFIGYTPKRSKERDITVQELSRTMTRLGIRADQALLIRGIAEKYAFNPSGVSSEESERLHDLYKHIKNTAYKQLGLYKKFVLLCFI